MKDKDVEIGMKVVPFQKTAGSTELKIGYPFLYVVGEDPDEISGVRVWILNERMTDGEGDFYRAEDFEPYTENHISDTDIIQSITNMNIHWGYERFIKNQDGIEVRDRSGDIIEIISYSDYISWAKKYAEFLELRMLNR